MHTYIMYDTYICIHTHTHIRAHTHTQVTPKFIAFAGPNTLAERDSTAPSSFIHDPSEYITEFRARNVTDIVRLNDAHTYDENVFREHGIAHHDLFFDDCTVPSLIIIEKFLDVCDVAKGVVAVHCLAGACA
jgi:cell division cycle 14